MQQQPQYAQQPQMMMAPGQPMMMDPNMQMAAPQPQIVHAQYAPTDIANMVWPRTPTMVVCPHCNQREPTKTEKMRTDKQCCLCCLMSFIGCCCIPYMIEDMYKVQHSCANCNEPLGAAMPK
ncbi:hypothetical protein FGO68_gene12099 [Halteria grandinella]|uniref:LITAF domain-containing protein n=1 Tax=Halteria grandinella TaxID=5974 RepID=A0A8J8NHM0_HALGN|nr:hypothetical protein FGO68_gene12099 [Halteria grandinella]